jgi:putative aminopeptidase FrvX
MDATLQLLKELTEAAGAPGQEDEVREVMRRHLLGVADRIRTDRLGSIVGEKVGDPQGPKVVIAGHLDEVAFMVSHITKEGFLRFQTLGGWWEQVMLAQRVVIKTAKGELLGVIGSKPPHILSQEERNKVVQKKDMFIDIGATSREQAEEFGVRPGDPVIPVCPFTVMRNEEFIMAKALDNRAGCGVAVEVLKQLKNQPHPNIVYSVGTVLEEVGARGAQTVTQMLQPDIFFAVDVGIAGDTPGVEEADALGKCGEGPLIVLYDALMVPHTRLRDLVIDTAKEEGIPYQFDVMPGGGTDAGRAHMVGDGVPSLVIGFPTRYIHSNAAILNRRDYENAIRLLVAVIRKLDRQTVESLRR